MEGEENLFERRLSDRVRFDSMFVEQLFDQKEKFSWRVELTELDEQRLFRLVMNFHGHFQGRAKKIQQNRFVDGRRGEFEIEKITLTEASFQVLNVSQTLQLAVRHDRQSIGEILALLHRMRSEDERRARRQSEFERRAHPPSTERIDAGRRLVQQDQRGRTETRQRGVKATQRAATELTKELVEKILQEENVRRTRHAKGQIFRSDRSDAAEEEKIVFHRQIVADAIVLRTVADRRANAVQQRLVAATGDQHRALRRSLLADENPEQRRFA